MMQVSAELEILAKRNETCRRARLAGGSSPSSFFWGVLVRQALLIIDRNKIMCYTVKNMLFLIG